MSIQQPNDKKSGPNQPVSSSDRTSFASKKIVILAVLITVILLTAIAVKLFMTDKVFDKSSKETTQTIKETQAPSTEFPKPDSVMDNKANDTDDYAKIISIALEIFWSGGNANGQEIKGHKYYPSAADVKNPDWAKKNLKLHDELIKKIKDGSVVYIPEGCDADKPSSDQNKCTSFVIQADGKTIAKSNN